MMDARGQEGTTFPWEAVGDQGGPADVLGRADMPFTGIATFARAPHMLLPEQAGELASLAADFVVYGVPFDCSTGYRPGQRMAPRAIRDMSTRFAMNWGPENGGYWDLDMDRRFLEKARLVDAGDVDPLYFDLEHLDQRASSMVEAIQAAGAVPIGLGGDHSVTFSMVKGLAPQFAPGGLWHGQRLEIVQIDAHLDFTDMQLGSFARSNSSPMRRASELDFVGGITCIGLRGLRTNQVAYQAALAWGSRLVSMGEVRKRGLEVALDALPESRPVYVTLDIDGLDPAIAPGTSSPEADGLSYAQLRELLHATSVRNPIIGADVVEVNPYLDVGNQTSLLAARAVVELMAFVHGARQACSKR